MILRVRETWIALEAVGRHTDPMANLDAFSGMRGRIALGAGFALIGLALAGCRAAATAPEMRGLDIVEAFPDLEFTRPLYVETPPDGTGRLFLLEQGGRVLWFENRAEVEQEDVVVALDLTEKVRSPVSEVPENRGHNEEGLLGMAFHPDFEENRLVYLHYSATNPEGAEAKQRGVISRFEMDEERRTIDPATEKVLLEVDQFRGNHNGGMIAFGPDGYLYISFGDGGGGGDPEKNGQNLETLLGAILRIDVDQPSGDRPYSIPEDNPFAGREDARGEIYAYGLRNVWRFSFDPETGDLWAGDVCQNAWEKIYLIGKGNNYGWPYLEGTHEHDGVPEGIDRDTFTPPIVEHPRSETRSITGGHIYRGEDLSDLQGAFIYGDFVTGAIFALWYDRENESVERHEKIGTVPAISSFGVDRAGELYIVSLSGKLFRFEPKAARD